MGDVFKFKAISKKYPDLQHGVGLDFYACNEGNDREIWEWNTTKYPEPTDAEMRQWILDFEYIDNRQYESIIDQMDALWHDIDDGKFSEAAKESSFYLMNKAVKDANPKP